MDGRTDASSPLTQAAAQALPCPYQIVQARRWRGGKERPVADNHDCFLESEIDFRNEVGEVRRILRKLASRSTYTGGSDATSETKFSQSLSMLLRCISTHFFKDANLSCNVQRRPS